MLCYLFVLHCHSCCAIDLCCIPAHAVLSTCIALSPMLCYLLVLCVALLAQTHSVISTCVALLSIMLISTYVALFTVTHVVLFTCVALTLMFCYLCIVVLHHCHSCCAIYLFESQCHSYCVIYLGCIIVDYTVSFTCVVLLTLMLYYRSNYVRHMS